MTNRVQRGGLWGWLCLVSNNRCGELQGLDWIQFQTVSSWAHERIVDFVVMWARAVCDQFWVLAVICFHCLLLFCGVFVFFFVSD